MYQCVLRSTSRDPILHIPSDIDHSTLVTHTPRPVGRGGGNPRRGGGHRGGHVGCDMGRP